MAQEQIQMEFREEIQKAQQMQQAIQANPQNQQLDHTVGVLKARATALPGNPKLAIFCCQFRDRTLLLIHLA